MIGVIVMRPMREYEVSLPRANKPRDNLAILQSGHNFTVMDIQYQRFHPHASGRLLGFGSASFGQWPPGHLPVTNVAIGHRDQFYLMAQLRPLDGTASNLKLRIIRMRSKSDNTQHSLGGGSLPGNIE